VNQLKEETEKLNHDFPIDESNIRGLSCLNNEEKQRDLDLAAYQEHGIAMDKVHFQ
jgi:hypothetical protein